MAPTRPQPSRRVRKTRVVKRVRVTRTVVRAPRRAASEVPSKSVRQTMLDLVEDKRPTAVGMSPTGISVQPTPGTPILPTPNPAPPPRRVVRVTKIHIHRQGRHG